MGLAGKTILVIEDSPLIAAACEAMLRDLECEVLGPTGSMATALDLSSNGSFDAAMVDLNIRGDKAFPILRNLDQRRAPYLIVSGYADWAMPEEWEDRPRMTKPFDATMLEAALSALLDEGSPAADRA